MLGRRIERGEGMLGRFLRLLLALLLCQILILVFFLFFVASALVSRGGGGVPIVHDHSTLAIEISGELVEYPTLPSVPFLNEPPSSHMDIVDALDRAAHDTHFDSAFLELDFANLGWGMAEELRAAIARFRTTGKHVYAFGTVLDEAAYYVAAACDSVYLPPQGKLALNGLALGAMYFKGAFDKLGVRANTHRIGAYKSAVEPYTRANMSEPARRNAEWLLADLWDEFRGAVARDRKLGPGAIDEVLERGTLQPEEALAARLVDDVRYRQDLAESFETDTGESRLVSVHDYRRTGGGLGGRPAIAVVHTVGFILSGKNGFNPALGITMGDASVVRDLEAAVEDEDIAAIVLRIDSPGGEVFASDAIGHAVERAKETKPIVVSMVDVAASGGYMIAYRASRVVAAPNTITGSIGSFTGKLVLHGLYDKLGLTKDFVTRGTHPLLYSDYQDWTAAEESLIVRQHWQDYRRWIDDIAAARELEPAAVDSIARGRVWSGRQAHELRLVDELGDLRRAVEIAADLAELEAGAKPHLVHFPKPAGLLDLIEERRDLLSALAAHAARAARLPAGNAWSVLDLRMAR
jgi:protease-4